MPFEGGNTMKETYIQQVKQELSLPKKKKEAIARDLREAFACALEHGETEQPGHRAAGQPCGVRAQRSGAARYQPCARAKMAQLPIHRLAPCRWHRAAAAGNRAAPEPRAAKRHWPGERANANPGARARHRSAHALPGAGLPLFPRGGACSGAPSPSQA